MTTACAVESSRSNAGRRSLWLLIAGALLAACTASSDEVRPPSDELFFPTGLAVVEDQANVLFVANANSELRYDTGAISVLDLTVIDAVVQAWLTGRDPGSCNEDPDHRETLICNESMFMKAGAGVRIGNFATDIGVQDFNPGGAPKLRLFVPTRGDPSVAWADYDGTQLACGGGSAFGVCDDQHRLNSLFNNPDEIAVPEEPFGVFATTQPADPMAPSQTKRGYAMVTHLSTGAVTLIDSPEDGTVQVSDIAVGSFAADPSTGLPGATGIAGRAPNTGNDIVYVGSRTEQRIQTFTVGRPVNNTPPYLLAGSYFFLDAVGGSSNVGSSVDGRGISFSETGDRLYLVNRRPPSLQVYDTSIGPTGVPLNSITGASDICRQASTVSVVNLGAEAGERAYVTCFQDGELYVVDPRGQSQVEDIITVGRGPYAVAAAKGRKRLFVSNYLEDTIAVIDIDPNSPTHNRVVLRIGEAKVPQ